MNDPRMPAANPHTVIFAGGGTGGHLFPALAVAEQLVQLRPGVRTLFLCSTRPLDAAILSEATLAGAAVNFRPVPAQPMSLRPKALARFIAGWGKAVRAGRAAIRESQRPGENREPGTDSPLSTLNSRFSSAVTIASFGGFVAAPIVQAARVEKCPVVLINLDAVPGKANRWIARHAARTATALPVPNRPTWQQIPPIVRRAALAPAPPADCRTRLGLDPSLRTLLVTGGSQGAGTINRLVTSLASSDPTALQGWQVVHQAGADAAEEVRGAYAAAGIPFLVEPFFAEMGLLWGAADLAVSRAGANSVAEAWANAVPTLFLPYPYHRDRHQAANAAPLVAAGTAAVADDLVDPAANAARVGPVLRELLTSPGKRAGMKAAYARLGPADGALQAAQLLIA